jgi:hypothetical protein
VIAGQLWSAFGAAVPFVFGAALSLPPAIILAFFYAEQSALCRT